MAIVVTKKNKARSGNFIALLRIIASGKLRAAVAIIKAKAVPRGTPLLKSTTAIGTIAAQLPYIGTPKITAIGTENGPVLLITDRIVSSGM